MAAKRIKETADKTYIEDIERISEVNQRERLVIFTVRALSGCLAATFFIIACTGFGWMKFDPSFLTWLGGITIAEIVTLGGLVFQRYFKKR